MKIAREFVTAPSSVVCSSWFRSTWRRSCSLRECSPCRSWCDPSRRCFPTGCLPKVSFHLSCCCCLFPCRRSRAYSSGADGSRAPGDHVLRAATRVRLIRRHRGRPRSGLRDRGTRRRPPHRVRTVGSDAARRSGLRPWPHTGASSGHSVYASYQIDLPLGIRVERLGGRDRAPTIVSNSVNFCAPAACAHVNKTSAIDTTD
jgi:hypothetical protein